MNTKNELSEPPIYPGHSITIAYEIITTFPSFEAAMEKSSNCEYPKALTDCRIHGAGGNVWNALHLLGLFTANEINFDQMIEWANRHWAACDNQKDKNPDRWKEGQIQAEQILSKLKELLFPWRKLNETTTVST